MKIKMYTIILLIFIFLKLEGTNSSISVLDKGMMSAIEPDSIGLQFYITFENLDAINACHIHVWPKRCCRLESGKEDCGSINVYGVNFRTIQPRDLETLIIVYPAIYKYNHVGYCDLLIETHCPDKKVKREIAHLPISTNVTDINKGLFKKVKSCKTEDQDPINDCLPVNCNEKYLGFRPYYTVVGKCAAAPICERDFTKDLPDVVYVPDSNTCRDLDNPISVADVYSFSSGYGVATESQKIEQITVELKSNLSTISQNLKFIKDLMYGKFYPLNQYYISTNYGESCECALWDITICILGLVAVLLSCVSCIGLSIWICKKWSTGDLGKIFSKAKRKVFKCESKASKVNKNVKNKLLQDVIVTNLPMELRESAINLCERIGKEVRQKRRYRADAIINVLKNEVSSSSDTSTQ